MPEMDDSHYHCDLNHATRPSQQRNRLSVVVWQLHRSMKHWGQHVTLFIILLKLRVSYKTEKPERLRLQLIECSFYLV
jgi:hypothetical protein